MKRAGTSGMTLIEVMIAITIFSIASLILINGFLMSAKINRKAMQIISAGSDLNVNIDITNTLPIENNVDINIAFGSTTLPDITGDFLRSTITDGGGVSRSRTIFVSDR